LRNLQIVVFWGVVPRRSRMVQTFRRNVLPPTALLPCRWHRTFIRKAGDRFTRLHVVTIRKSNISFRGQFLKVPCIKL